MKNSSSSRELSLILGLKIGNRNEGTLKTLRAGINTIETRHLQVSIVYHILLKNVKYGKHVECRVGDDI